MCRSVSATPPSPFSEGFGRAFVFLYCRVIRVHGYFIKIFNLLQYSYDDVTMYLLNTINFCLAEHVAIVACILYGSLRFYLGT